jgi:hypothetical protein
MRNLPDVTLCCVDTRLPRMALDAMRHCMQQISFGDAILFTCPDHGLTDLPAGLRIVELRHITNIEAYSHFLLKEMGPYLHTSHQLIVQWDGYVLDPAQWDDAFLAMDYIGAVWPQYHDAHRVGNGGFSLRSRKLLDALTSPDIRPEHPEDVCIARTHRDLLERRWGIQFADEATAHRFAFERDRQAPASFGFHGMSNMALILDEPALQRFMADAPVGLFASVEARSFIKHLIRRKLKPLAREALRRRRQSRTLDLADLRLWLRLAL